MGTTRSLAWGCLILASALVAEEPAGTRGLWNTEFSSQRPARKAVARPAKGNADLIGLTVWRLRPARPADPAITRLLEHESDRSAEYVPERVSSSLPLGQGDRVRLTVESARTGYLYVISREVYAGGEMGQPFLIFPTLRLRGGDNRVSPGRVVEIPGWDDRPPYLTLRRSRVDQVQEQLVVLVAPRPLPEITPVAGAQRLDLARLESWEARWGGKTVSLEAPELAGHPISGAERTAAQGGAPLDPQDPLPQTLLRAQAGPGQPLLVSVRLHLRP